MRLITEQCKKASKYIFLEGRREVILILNVSNLDNSTWLYFLLLVDPSEFEGDNAVEVSENSLATNPLSSKLCGVTSMSIPTGKYSMVVNDEVSYVLSVYFRVIRIR